MAKKKTHKQIEISNEDVHLALRPLQELARKDLNTKVAYNIARTLTNVEAEIKRVQEFRQDLLKKFAKLDKAGEVVLAKGEDGEPKVGQNGQPTGEPVWDDEEGYNKAVEELAEATADFKAFCVTLDDLGPTTRATSLMALDWFIMFDDEDEDEDEDEAPAAEPAKKAA